MGTIFHKGATMGTKKAEECKECGVSRDDTFVGRLCLECYNKSCRDRYHRNRKRYSASSMIWRENNLDQYRETQRVYHANRYANPDNRAKINYKNGFGACLKRWVAENKLEMTYPRLKNKSVVRFEKLIGCSFETLTDRMEQHWMKDFGVEIDWNHFFIPSCPHKLEIEHITKVHTFDFTVEGDAERCYHFSNLKMLPQKINRTGRPCMAS